MLLDAPPPFDPELAERLLAQRGLPYLIRYTAQTGSTNQDALLAARGPAHHRTVFVAEEQTAGRGREGRSWFSQRGASLTFSVLYRPGWQASHSTGFALVVGLAAQHALSRYATKPLLLKWPNDLLLQGKKVCGILVETQIRGSLLGALVVGIGINVDNRELPSSFELEATSLCEHQVAPVSREELLLAVLEELDQRYQTFEERGLASFVQELATADALFGRRVRVGSLEGVASGIGPDGSLRLTTDEGVLKRIFAGSVRLIN